MDHKTYVSDQKFYSNANIELTNKCALSCAQCVRSFLKIPDKNDPRRVMMHEKIKESGDIELNDLRKLLDFFDTNISFCGQFSDPVYHKKFYQILKICSTEYSDKKIRIHTASHQKNLEWYRKAFELTGDNIFWVFGLDGLPDTSPIHRIGQNSELIYDAMILAAKMGIKTVWQFIVFGHNEHQVYKAKEIAAEHGIMLKIMKTDRVTSNIKQASIAFRPRKEKESLTYNYWKL